MNDKRLITPAEFIKRGSVTSEKMEQLINHLRATVKELANEFPDASFQFDADFILRVEADAEDATEIDHVLQDTLTAFTPFSITVRR